MAAMSLPRLPASRSIAGRTSIIIPTRGPSWPLSATLNSLSVALPIGADVELVLVHDGPEIDLSETVSGFGYPTTVVHTGRPSGAATARNLGYARATGDLLIFLDDDTAIPPGWLEGAWNAAAMHPDAGLIGARLRPTEPENLISQAFGTLVIRHERRAERWYLATACLAVRRPAFEALGGFDERFDDASGEDWDFCRRAHDLGIGVAATDAFTVYHRNPTRFRQILSRSRRYARSAPMRFSADRTPPPGDTEEQLVTKLQRGGSPLIIGTHLLIAGPREVTRRYRSIRAAGLGHPRAALIMIVHLPWLASYALFSVIFATQRRDQASR